MAQKKPSNVIHLDEAKRWLRRALIRKRQSISVSHKKKWSQAAVDNLVRSPFYRKSKTIALFLGFGSEIATESLVERAWKDGKNVLLPITRDGFQKPFFAVFRKGDKLMPSKFGPLELVQKKKPFHFGSVDMVVVPGLGFDTHHHRLGYGGGVYDRILEKTPRAKHVGLFFSSQRLPALPRAAHDVKMHAFVTEKGI